jgi:uncharacterized protein (TIGR00369 family)
MNDPDIEQRRTVVTALAAAIRNLTTTSIRSEVSIDDLRGADELVQRASAILGAEVRSGGHLSSVDDVDQNIRLFTPISGVGNPVAPPIRWVTRTDEQSLARVTLDTRYEGPPRIAHGGIAAAILDEVLGSVASRSSHLALTASLQLNYLRPLPLDTELEARAEIVERAGRKTWVEGRLGTRAEPEVACVTARALFITPSVARSRDYFGRVMTADGRPAVTRRDG